MACTSQAAHDRGRALARALKDGFGIQYWGEGYNAADLAARPHGLLIIELTKVSALYSESGREEMFTPEEIAAITRDGSRPVLGYLNVGEIENYRDYWVDFVSAQADVILDDPPEWFGPHAGHGDHLAAFWTRGWRDVVLNRVDRLMERGVSGLFLDDVLHYYSHANDAALAWSSPPAGEQPTEAPQLARAMMALVAAIADRARSWRCNAFVVVNNAVFIGRDAAETPDEDGTRPQFDRYRARIDAIMVENILAPSAHQDTRNALVEDFRAEGVQVMTLDALSHAPETDYTALRRRLSQKAFKAGFAPYIVDEDGFSRLYPPLSRPEGF